MKSTRLIKREELMNRPPTGERRTTDVPAGGTDLSRTVKGWVREHQELRRVNPRLEFAALFSRAA